MLHAASPNPSETAINKVQNLRMPTPRPARVMTKFYDNFRVVAFEFRFDPLLYRRYACRWHRASPFRAP